MQEVSKKKSLKEKIHLKKWKGINDMSVVRLLFIAGMLIKTFLFMSIVETKGLDTIDTTKISYIFTFSYLSFVLIVYSFGYLFKKNIQTVYYVVISTLYSILLIADLCYFKVNYDILGVKNILFPGTFNVTKKSLNNFIPLYLVFFIDVIVLLAYIIIRKVKNDSRRSFANFFYTFKIGILIVLISIMMFDGKYMAGWGKAIVEKQWTVLMSMRAPGPLGYHFVEGIKSINKSIYKITKEEKSEVTTWLNNNKEDLPDNKYSGIFKGKNVIFVQCESLENFILNKKTNGQEITPFLNSLTKKGLYFDNFYEQNNGANSIDCDLMVNTSIYPLGDEITVTNYGENVYPNSLQRILEKSGYSTVTAHAVEPDEFNGTELHVNGLGVQKYLHVEDFKYDESIGYGLSDRSMLSQLADKLKTEKQPFLVETPTLSTHGPFNLDPKYRELNLPEEVDKSYLGGYFQSFHFFDEQLKMFFDKLESNGLLDNTVLVLYGDHAGVHKYYNDDIQKLDYEDGWWKEYDHRIPLIIYSKGIEPQVISTYGGQTDMLPTISYMFGIDKNEYINTSMGKVLVNTNRNATVIKNNEIIGNVKDEDEKQHLLSAYKIGDIILRNNYFYNNSK